MNENKNTPEKEEEKIPQEKILPDQTLPDELPQGVDDQKNSVDDNACDTEEAPMTIEEMKKERSRAKIVVAAIVVALAVVGGITGFAISRSHSKAPASSSSEITSSADDTSSDETNSDDETSSDEDTSSDTASDEEQSTTDTESKEENSENAPVSSETTETPSTTVSQGTVTSTPATTESKEPTTTKPATPSQAPSKGNQTVVTEQTIVYPATCTEDGYTLHLKSDGTSYKDNITKATGHDWGDWVVISPATTEYTGIEQRTCKNCGEKESREIPKLPQPTIPPVTPPTSSTTPTTPTTQTPTNYTPSDRTIKEIDNPFEVERTYEGYYGDENGPYKTIQVETPIPVGGYRHAYVVVDYRNDKSDVTYKIKSNGVEITYTNEAGILETYFMDVHGTQITCTAEIDSTGHRTVYYDLYTNA